MDSIFLTGKFSAWSFHSAQNPPVQKVMMSHENVENEDSERTYVN